MNDLIIVNKALFMETGTYNDMALRPYQTTIDGSVLNNFREVTDNGRSIAASGLSAVAGSFLKPHANTSSIAQIENGWSTPRFRFMLDIEFTNSMGTTQRKIIQGYTGYLGITSSEAVDPSMPLFFNNALTIRNSLITTAHGQQNTAVLSESNQILRGKYEYEFDSTGSTTTLLRPEDVFKNLGAGGAIQKSMGDVCDTRPTFADSPIKKSRRSNNLAAPYLANTLNTYVNTFNVTQGIDVLSGGDKFAEASGMVQEDTFASDQFFSMLIRKSHDFAEQGFITYGELSNLIAGLDHNSKFIMATDIFNNTPHNPLLAEAGSAMSVRGNNQGWGGANNETIWATTLNHSLPSIMMDLMLTKVTFMATNRITIHNSRDAHPLGHIVKIINVESFADNVDLGPYIQVFIDRLVSEVLRNLAVNKDMDYEIIVTLDVIGDSSIAISLFGEQQLTFTNAQFADALMSPVLGADGASLSWLAHDIGELASNLQVTTQHPNQTSNGVNPNEF